MRLTARWKSFIFRSLPHLLNSPISISTWRLARVIWRAARSITNDAWRQTALLFRSQWKGRIIYQNALGAAALALDLAALGKKLDLATGNSSPELFSPLNRLSDYKILFVSLLWVEGWKARQMLAKAAASYFTCFSLSLALSLSRPQHAPRKQQTLLWSAREDFRTCFMLLLRVRK
jgi:hypothetical protein